MATRKPKAETPAQPAKPCINCGQRAVWKTVNPGAEVGYYCDACALAAYPLRDGYLERLG